MARSNFPYRSGTCLAICDRCGLKFYGSELRHDGHFSALLVCEHCYDPRHPQLDVRGVANISVPNEARPEPDAAFHFDDSTDYPGVIGTNYPKSF